MGLTQRLLAELGATPERLGSVRTPSELESLKVDVRSAFRALAFKYHPDRNPDDNGLVFKALNEALKWVLALEPKPVVVTTVTYMYPSPNTRVRPVSPKRVYDARRVAVIRPA